MKNLSKSNPFQNLNPTRFIIAIMLAFMALSYTGGYEAHADAETNKLTWKTAKDMKGTPITFIQTIVKVVMAVFILVSIIMGSLAFKGLASDGNWKDFWSKIAGSMGMFVVPLVVYYLAGVGADGTIK